MAGTVAATRAAVILVVIREVVTPGATLAEVTLGEIPAAVILAVTQVAATQEEIPVEEVLTEEGTEAVRVVLHVLQAIREAIQIVFLHSVP